MSKKIGKIISELKKIYEKEGEMGVTIFDIVDRMYEMIRKEISRFNLQVYVHDLRYEIWKNKIEAYVIRFRELKEEEKKYEKASFIIQKWIKKYHNRKKKEYIQLNSYEIDSGEYGDEDEEYTEDEINEIEKINKIEYSDYDISYNTFYWDSEIAYI
tara:strand:+ start:236 stop:706 length:471 start_codon:yes stop_codon:yes gene_type:complete